MYIHFVWTDPLPEKSCEQKKIQFDNACVVKEAVYSTLILFCSWSQFLFLLYAVLAKTQCTHNFKKGANFGRFDCVIFSGEENKIMYFEKTYICSKFFITIKLPIHMSRSHIENEFWGIYTMFSFLHLLPTVQSSNILLSEQCFKNPLPLKWIWIVSSIVFVVRLTQT